VLFIERRAFPQRRCFGCFIIASRHSLFPLLSNKANRKDNIDNSGKKQHTEQQVLVTGPLLDCDHTMPRRAEISPLRKKELT
jgi:hypothetical protein